MSYPKYYMIEFGGTYGWFQCFRARLAYRDRSDIQLSGADVLRLHLAYTRSLSPINLADKLIKELEKKGC